MVAAYVSDPAGLGEPPVQLRGLTARLGTGSHQPGHSRVASVELRFRRRRVAHRRGRELRRRHRRVVGRPADPPPGSGPGAGGLRWRPGDVVHALLGTGINAALLARRGTLSRCFPAKEESDGLVDAALAGPAVLAPLMSSM